MSYLGLETMCEVVSLNFDALISTAKITRIDLKEPGTGTRTQDQYSILKSSTPVKCHFGHIIIIVVVLSTSQKCALQSFHPSQ